MTNASALKISIDRLLSLLRSSGHKGLAIRLEELMQSAATSGEMLMALRWELKKSPFSDKQLLPREILNVIDDVIRQIDASGV